MQEYNIFLLPTKKMKDLSLLFVDYNKRDSMWCSHASLVFIKFLPQVGRVTLLTLTSNIDSTFLHCTWLIGINLQLSWVWVKYILHLQKRKNQTTFLILEKKKPKPPTRPVGSSSILIYVGWA